MKWIQVKKYRGLCWKTFNDPKFNWKRWRYKWWYLRTVMILGHKMFFRKIFSQFMLMTFPSQISLFSLSTCSFNLDVLYGDIKQRFFRSLKHNVGGKPSSTVLETNYSEFCDKLLKKMSVEKLILWKSWCKWLKVTPDELVHICFSWILNRNSCSGIPNILKEGIIHLVCAQKFRKNNVF